MARPEMMAIGDSVFNGVRSMTISPELAQWSVPAQVARALNVPFVIPDYPRHVILNVEDWLRQLPNVFGIADDIERNILFWESRPLSRLPQFDNIAIASSSYRDLYARTWETAQDEIDGLRGSLGADFSKVNHRLAELCMAFNTRFLLNPMGDMTAPALSPLEIVARRQPRRLLVNIGGNNGLWNMAFAAEASNGAGGADGPFNASDLADLSTLITGLKALPASVEHIYLNALPLPSGSANMSPTPGFAGESKPGSGRYYPLYENRFGFGYGTLTAEQMRVNDDTVHAVNEFAEREASSDPRIHIVRIDRAFGAYDFKASDEAQVVRTSDGRVLSNLMIQGPSLFDPRRWRGGLDSLDGMHPTLVGYAIMAQAILGAIRNHEGVVATTPPDLEVAYRADTLLQNLPSSWDLVLSISRDLRRAMAALAPPVSPEHAAVGRFLGAVQFKYD